MISLKIKLREKRIESGLSKTELAKASRVALSYISEMENGKYKNPSTDTICRLCKALNCSPNDLIDCDN